MNLDMKDYKMKAIGVGGCGHSNLSMLYPWLKDNVKYIVMNSDAQDLEKNPAKKYGTGPSQISYMQLGEKITRGLGSGGLSELAKNLALADKERIQALLLNTDVVFIVAGMGGGMGSGVAPLIASYAKKAGAIVIGIVTMPFSYEGARRLRNAEAGLHNLKCYADTVVVIDNNDLVKQGGKLSEVLRLKLADYVPEITRVMLDDVWQTYRKLERMIGTYAYLQEFIDTQRKNGIA